MSKIIAGHAKNRIDFGIAHAIPPLS